MNGHIIHIRTFPVCCVCVKCQHDFGVVHCNLDTHTHPSGTAKHDVSATRKQCSKFRESTGSSAEPKKELST